MIKVLWLGSAKSSEKATQRLLPYAGDAGLEVVSLPGYKVKTELEILDHAIDNGCPIIVTPATRLAVSPNFLSLAKNRGVTIILEQRMFVPTNCINVNRTTGSITESTEKVCTGWFIIRDVDLYEGTAQDLYCYRGEPLLMNGELEETAVTSRVSKMKGE